MISRSTFVNFASAGPNIRDHFDPVGRALMDDVEPVEKVRDLGALELGPREMCAPGRDQRRPGRGAAGNEGWWRPGAVRTWSEAAL